MKYIELKVLDESKLVVDARTGEESEVLDWFNQGVASGRFMTKPVYRLESFCTETFYSEDGKVITPMQSGTVEVEEIPAREMNTTIQDITVEYLQSSINEESQKFLSDSDYIVLRNIREKALGLAPTLSEEDYLQLELARHQAASRIVK